MVLDHVQLIIVHLSTQNINYSKCITNQMHARPSGGKKNKENHRF